MLQIPTRSNESPKICAKDLDILTKPDFINTAPERTTQPGYVPDSLQPHSSRLKNANSLTNILAQRDSGIGDSNTNIPKDEEIKSSDFNEEDEKIPSSDKSILCDNPRPSSHINSSKDAASILNYARDEKAANIHRSKSFIINLIDRALSKELGTLPDSQMKTRRMKKVSKTLVRATYKYFFIPGRPCFGTTAYGEKTNTH